ncbi:MAG TPA: M20/M25/M40 family metallo-hydrolase, partial [Pseudonocardiaceae bacterium]|nr:M20/M25/M40 family metallo-hydrolase [Pseudonocardiaceae bacterium]
MSDHRLITATDLVELTRELVAVNSVSGAEAELADLVERRLRERACAMDVRRIGNNVVARTDDGHAARVVLAGHLDTVPLHELAGVRPAEEADRVHGRGAVDMKGG